MRRGGEQGEARTGTRSGTSSPMRGAARRSRTSSPLQMWGGGSQPPAEEDVQSEASECELRERQYKEEAEEVDAEGEGQPLFLPTPAFMAFTGEE